MKTTTMENDVYFREYTSQDAIVKYTRATAGYGISYLLDHDYKRIYLEALKLLPPETKQRGIRMLEFGCGGGMNLVHLISVFSREGIRIQRAVGTDFSPVLIDAARNEARSYLREEAQRNLEFYVGKNETLVGDLASATGTEISKIKGSFDFVFGVNTIRYCHDAEKEQDCARGLYDLLVPGGMCVVIDMNNRYPCFRSDLKSRLAGTKEEECYVPSLEEYTAPFPKAGFEVLRSEHFCWVPHSAGRLVSGVFSVLTPVLNGLARSRAMRSLVVSRKPR